MIASVKGFFGRGHQSSQLNQSMHFVVNDFMDNLLDVDQQKRINRDCFDSIKGIIVEAIPAYEQNEYSLTWHDFGEILDQACKDSMDILFLTSDKINLNEIGIRAEKIKNAVDANNSKERVKIKSQYHTPESLLLTIAEAHDMASLKLTIEQRQGKVKRKFK